MCGMLWELLPTAQDTKVRRRAFDKHSMTAIAAFAGVLVGGGAIAWVASLLRGTGTFVGMLCLAALAVAVAYWRDARPRR